MGRIFQYLVYPVVWGISKLFCNEIIFNNEGRLVQIVGRPAIIVANHISMYDSFLLRLSRYWMQLHVSFMGVRKFKSVPLRILNMMGIIPIIYKLFGVFTVVPGLGLEKNLQIAQEIILKNRAVFMFPEGSINTDNNLLPFKKGAAALAVATGALVLPIGYSQIRKKILGKKITITFGEPIHVDVNSSIEDVTKEFETIIHNLSGKGLPITV